MAPNVKMGNGKEIPIIGLGTWKVSVLMFVFSRIHLCFADDIILCIDKYVEDVIQF